MLKKTVLVVLLLLACVVDGLFHYREHKKILALEWQRDVVTLQRDMLVIEFQRMQRDCEDTSSQTLTIANTKL